MRTFFIILIALFARIPVKACSLSSYEYCKIALGKETLISKAGELTFSDQVPYRQELRKKHKLKGTEVSGASITRQQFTFIVCSSDYVFTTITCYPNTLYFISSPTRGPPQA